jgi:riboflavin kinase/FMN adenylyltransferase
MQTLSTLAELRQQCPQPCVAIGVFDGVHVGHQAVIRQAIVDARARSGTAVVLTFDPHPQTVLQPDKAPALLTSTAHKLRLIAELGVDACVVLKFDQAFAALTPEEFINRLCQSADRLQTICVGTRFHFGHSRAGNIRLIEQLAPRYGYTAREIEPVKVGEHLVSSTAIRQHLRQGHLDVAAAMLGRPYSVLGTVEHGDHLGQQLGFPTANVNPHHEALPPYGVYAVRAQIVEQASRLFPASSTNRRDACSTYPGIANLGHRPTVTGDSGARRLEVHLFDFDRDLYGTEIEVIFIQKIRDEQKFASLEALKTQIATDIATARAILHLPS